MSFMGKVFHAPWNTKAYTFTGFARNTGLNFRQPRFSRAFHGHAKRPRVTKASMKWGVFDELKLFSYTSHLAFFMLLPPIIQMYTTKVEVTRDETISESPFAAVETSHGIVIRNMNFLDILQAEKNKLVDMYLQSETNTGTTLESSKVDGFVPNNDTVPLADRPAKEQRPAEKPEIDQRLELQLAIIDDAYNSLQRNLISDNQYMITVQKVTDQLLGIEQRSRTGRSDKELANNTIMRIFDQLHSLRLHTFESDLFRRLVTSHTQPDVKFLNIKHTIVQNYEISKAVGQKHKHKHARRLFAKNRVIKKDSELPLHDAMGVSLWLRSYVRSFERFAQLVQMFATTGQTKKAFHSLFHVGFESPEVCKQIQNPEQRYGLVSALRGSHREKEAHVLERKIRSLASA